MKKNLAKLLAVSVSMGMLTACGGNGGKTETTCLLYTSDAADD